MRNYRDYENTLTALRQNLTANLEALDYIDFNRAPEGGGWSAAQTLSHIIGAERTSLAYLHKKIQQPEVIPAGGMKARVKSALLGLAMASPIKIKVPPGVPEVVEQASFEELDNQWSAVREDWGQFLSSYPPDLAERAIYRHPVMGRLTLAQTLRFLITHLKRHSRQIERALAK